MLTSIGVTVRNCNRGISAIDEWLDVRNCTFINNQEGINAVLSGETRMANSQFLDNRRAGAIVFRVRGSTGATVEECEFIGADYGIDLQSDNCILRDSKFRDNVVGAQVGFGGTAAVSNCVFENQGNVGIGILNGAQMQMDGCVFIPPSGINIFLAGYLTGSANELNGASFASIQFSYQSEFNFHGNHILNGGGWSVYTGGTGSLIKHRDLSENYWGTTDTLMLDTWIWDRADDPTVSTFVEYEPMLEAPVAVKQQSIGSLKAGFGQQQSFSGEPRPPCRSMSGRGQLS